MKRFLRPDKPDELPLVKYDVRRPQESGGGFTEKYWRLVTFPGFDASGKVSHIIHRVEDVTERKMTEEILRESERRLKFTLAAGQLGSYEYYPQTRKNVFFRAVSGKFRSAAGCRFSV